MERSQLVDEEKELAAQTAAAMVQDGMRVGLGTGSTVAHLLAALAARSLDISCVATSPATERRAKKLGLRVEYTFDSLDIAIDGADQVSPDGWLIKGGGGAHTREKQVAAAARSFVVIVDSTKAVANLKPPLPVELLAFGVESTLMRCPDVVRRDAPLTPDGGVLADFMGSIDDPNALAQRLSATPGIVEHGLFAPAMVSVVLIAHDGVIERRNQ